MKKSLSVNPIVNIANLNKSYRTERGEQHILFDVNLMIEKGDMMAVMGPSGSGKSTLLHILGLLDHFDSGDYTLCGENVGLLNEDRMAFLRNHRIGYVFQHFHLLPRLTVMQNIVLPLLYRGNKQKQYAHQAMSLLQSLGLSGYENKYPLELSGGQQQRVAIARALIIDPDLILADEPTGALDSKTSADVMEIFKMLNRDQCKTIVIVTHDEWVSKQCRQHRYCLDGRLALHPDLVSERQSES